MKNENVFSEIMNYTVSGYVYFVAFTLVLYMVGSLVTGLLALGTGLLEISSSPQEFLLATERNDLGYEMLHTIAFTIVLVKAYKILIAFAEVRYFNLKFLLEIAIIAPIIELIFNSRDYSIEMNALFAAFALFNLIAYLFFYKTIRQIGNDYENDRCLMYEERAIQKAKKVQKTKAKLKSKENKKK